MLIFFPAQRVSAKVFSALSLLGEFSFNWNLTLYSPDSL